MYIYREKKGFTAAAAAAARVAYFRLKSVSFLLSIVINVINVII